MTTGRDSQPAVKIETGTLIGQRYRVERPLDNTVNNGSFVARQVALDRLVVVHVFGHQDESTSEFVQRFESEATALTRLRHERVVSLLDHGRLADGLRYIVCEALDGPTLSDYLDSHQIDLDTCVELALDICSALEESHRLGILHQNINPANIIITQSEDGLCATLKGFGFQYARKGSANLGHTRNRQAQSDSIKDARVDLYGLGTVIYQCLTGESATGLGQVDSFNAKLRKRFGAESEKCHHLSDVLLDLLQVNGDGQLTTARQLASRLSQIRTLKTAKPMIQQVESGDPMTFKGAPVRDRKTDPMGSRAPSNNRFQGHQSQWIPRWSYIIGLGLISLSVIGLTRIQDLANKPAGQTHTRQLDRHRPEQTIAVNEFVEITKRHLELARGQLNPHSWTDNRVLWSKTHLSAYNADFGLASRPMSDSLPELKKGLYQLEKGRSLDTPLTYAHLHQRAAFRWQQAILGHPKKPDYRPAIPVLEQIIDGRFQQVKSQDTARHDVWTATYYLSVALASIGQINESQVHLNRLLDQGTGVVTDLARIHLLMSELERDETHLLDAHLALAMNSKIEWVRHTAQYVKILRSWKRGQYESVLDQCFTFLESTTHLANQARYLRPLVFEFMLMTAPRIEKGDFAVQSFIRGYGGQALIRYYLPLQALAYSSIDDWASASKCYSAQLAIPSFSAAQMARINVLRAAEAFIRSGHNDALDAIKERLAFFCGDNIQPLDTRHFSCQYVRRNSQMDGGLPSSGPP
ncbi:MAG: protein kinase [Myxococcota bacterium]|nr:protein kinase [Myxococcota bacterium]